MRAREDSMRKWRDKAEVDVYRARGKEERSSRRKRVCAWRMGGEKFHLRLPVRLAMSGARCAQPSPPPLHAQLEQKGLL